MKSKTTQRKGLNGLYFLSFDKEKKLKWQGVIKEMIGEYLLVDTFSWITEDYWCSNLIPISQCCEDRWDFYYLKEDWQDIAKRAFEAEKRTSSMAEVERIKINE